MPHFAHPLIASDPEALARLREVLHGPQGAPPAMPNLAERFGAAQQASEAVQAMRKPRRRRQAAGAPASSLVTP